MPSATIRPSWKTTIRSARFTVASRWATISVVRPRASASTAVWTARSLHMHDKPVVLLDPWDDLAPLVELAQSLQRKGFVRPAALAHLLRTSSVEQALDAVEIELAAALR